jgi:hypothetical protein
VNELEVSADEFEDYCLDCKANVARCWEVGGVCCGGGHCEECGGYNFGPVEVHGDHLGLSFLAGDFQSWS